MSHRIARATIDFVRAVASARLHAPAADVFAALADLTTWPHWLDVVTRVVPTGDGAWRARLGVRVGPLDLGRDVRLVVTVTEAPTRLIVERRELDDRDDHSPIELAVTLADAAADADGPATDVTLSALVGKRLPLLDLQREIERRGPDALRRLEHVVATRRG